MAEHAWASHSHPYLPCIENIYIKKQIQNYEKVFPKTEVSKPLGLRVLSLGIFTLWSLLFLFHTLQSPAWLVALFFLEVSFVFPQWLSTESPRRRLWSEKSGRTRCSWPHLPPRSLLRNRSSIRPKRSSLRRLLCSLRRISSVSPLRPCRPMGPSRASSRMPSPKCRMVCGFCGISFICLFVSHNRKENKRIEN